MLVVAERNFYGFKLWQAACASGARLLWRVKSNLGLPVEQELAGGSYLSTVFDSEDRARRNGQRVRVIDYILGNRLGPKAVIRGRFGQFPRPRVHGTRQRGSGANT